MLKYSCWSARSDWTRTNLSTHKKFKYVKELSIGVSIITTDPNNFMR